MRNLFFAGLAVLALAACSPAATTTATTSATASADLSAEPVSDLQSDVSPTAAYIVAAVADAHRPAADRARDALRHPAETLALSQIKPGQKIGELLPGEGYFTRLFSDAVGAHGHVYPISRSATDQYEHSVLVGAANVTNVTAPYTAFTLPEPMDLIFTAQNYHDFKINQYQMGDTVALDHLVFNSLKPGGVYVIIDHSAVAGTTMDQAHPLHRIDQAVVRREVESVGFIYDGESQILRNPADPRTANVFDPSIRGHTDQFFMRFHKPG
ncbi:MAG: methyltransferase [Alphaproteobacteria bacterium]